MMDYWIINECKSSTAVGGITPGTELARVCFQEKAGLLGRGWRWRGPCVAWRAHERREISVSFFTLHVQPVHTGSGSREPASNPGEKQRGKARRPLASHRIASQLLRARWHCRCRPEHGHMRLRGRMDLWHETLSPMLPSLPSAAAAATSIRTGASRGEAGAPSHDLVSRAWLVRSAARAAGSGMDGSTPLAERGVVPAAAVVSCHACTVQGTVTVFCFGCRDGCCDEANHRGRVRWHSGMSWWYRVRGQRRHMAPAMAEYSTRRP